MSKISFYRPPSIDRMEQVTLKECPLCTGEPCLSNELLPDYVTCLDCGMDGPLADPHGHKWNSIPRRSEVRELLWFIDMVGQHVIAAEPGSYTLAGDINRMCDYADKLRKEWNL